MNYNLLKSRMDKFFKEVSTEDLVQDLKSMGYSVFDFSDANKRATGLSVEQLASLKINELLAKRGTAYKQAGDDSYAEAA